MQKYKRYLRTANKYINQKLNSKDDKMIIYAWMTLTKQYCQGFIVCNRTADIFKQIKFNYISKNNHKYLEPTNSYFLRRNIINHQLKQFQSASPYNMQYIDYSGLKHKNKTSQEKQNILRQVSHIVYESIKDKKIQNHNDESDIIFFELNVRSKIKEKPKAVINLTYSYMMDSDEEENYIIDNDQKDRKQSEINQSKLQLAGLLQKFSHLSLNEADPQKQRENMMEKSMIIAEHLTKIKAQSAMPSWLLSYSNISETNEENQSKFQIDEQLINKKKIKVEGHKITKIDSACNHLCGVVNKNPMEIGQIYKTTIKIIKQSQLVFGIVTEGKKMNQSNGGFKQTESLGYWSNQNGQGCIYVNGTSNKPWKQGTGAKNGESMTMIVDLKEWKITVIVPNRDQDEDTQTKEINIKLEAPFKDKKLYMFIQLKDMGDSVEIF